MSAGISGGSTSQVNWAARFFWFTSMTFAVIGGGMEAYVYFAYTDANLWTWVGIAEASARAIGTQLVIMTLTLAGVKLWQSGAHAVWKVILFGFFQVIAFGAATHGFVLVWVAAVAFRRQDLLGSADQGVIEVPFIGTFPLATLVLVLIAALPYYETILSLIGPIVTKDRRALSPEEIEEQNLREQAMARLNETRQKNLASSMMGWRNAGAALITGKVEVIEEPQPIEVIEGARRAFRALLPNQLTPETVGKILGVTGRTVRDRMSRPVDDPLYIEGHAIEGTDRKYVELDWVREHYAAKLASYEKKQAQAAERAANKQRFKLQPGEEQSAAI